MTARSPQPRFFFHVVFPRPVALAFLCLSAALPAEDIFIDDPFASLHEQARDPLEQICTHVEAKLTRGMAVHVEAMKLVCDLDDEQLAALTTASKGAVERTVEVWSEKINEDNPGIAQQVVQMKAGAPGEAAFDGLISSWCGQPPPPASEALWINAVAESLRKDQLAQWTKARDARAARVRALAIEEALFRMDQKLFLSDRQFASMKVLVTEQLGDQLTVRKEAAELRQAQGGGLAAIMGGRMNFQIRRPQGGGGNGAADAVDLAESDLRKILTETQIAHWPAAREAILGHENQNHNPNGMLIQGW